MSISKGGYAQLNGGRGSGEPDKLPEGVQSATNPWWNSTIQGVTGIQGSPSGSPNRISEPELLGVTGIQSIGGEIQMDRSMMPETRLSSSVARQKEQKDRLIGSTIDGFKILSLIGEGGFSQVYKVSPEKLENQYFALKFVPNKAHAPLLEAEAQILATLKHPNIPTPVRLGSYDGGTYLVMDFIPNTLHNVLQNIPGAVLPLDRALLITKELLEILNYAHSCNIVHKDLKPRNIGLDENDNVYLFDFNIAKTLQTTNPVSQVAVENSGLQSDIIQIADVQKSLLGGTEGYQSPEQRRLEVNGQVHPVTAKSDIYTTGIVFYQLLMGSLPFGSYTKPSKKGHPHWVDELVDSALQPNPDERCSAHEMLRVINKGLDGEFDRAPIPPQPSKLWAFLKSAILLPFKIVFSPLILVYWLFSGGLVSFANRHNSSLAPIAVLMTLALWSSPFWGIPLGYKISRNYEIEQIIRSKPLKGTLIYTKNKTLAVITAQAALDKSSDPSVIITRNDIEDLAYLGNNKIGYIYKHSIWVLDLKDGTNKQILATKGSSDDRFISRIEADNGKICFKISSDDRWFGVNPDGKALAELNLLLAFKPKNISPDGNFLIDKGSLIWNHDRWGSLNLVDCNKAIWVPEELNR